jgi:phage repressor protein C with HTH and peptisase S24 domain
MSLAQRLTHARLESGYSEAAEAARKAGITPSALYQLEDGTTKSLSGQTAVKLGRAYPEFRVEWLIDGSGPQRRDEPLPAASYSETPPGYVRFRVLEGEASGGYGVMNDDFPEVVQEMDIAEWQVRSQIGFVPEKDRVKLVTVRGDSMYPDIKNGDVVMVDVYRNFFEGDGIYLINLSGYTLVKRLQMLHDGLHIISTNSKYRSQVIAVDEIESIHVAGRVLGAALLRRSEEF